MHLAWHSQGKLQEGSSRMGLHCQAFHHLYCLYVTGVSSLCLDKPLTTHLRRKISSLFPPGQLDYHQVPEGCSVQGVSGGEWASCDPGTV